MSFTFKLATSAGKVENSMALTDGGALAVYRFGSIKDTSQSTFHSLTTFAGAARLGRGIGWNESIIKTLFHRWAGHAGTRSFISRTAAHVAACRRREERLIQILGYALYFEVQSSQQFSAELRA